MEIVPGFAFKKKSHEEDFDLFLHSVELVLVNNGEKIDVEESETSLEEIFVSAWLARSSRIRGSMIWIRVRVEGIRVDKGETLSG